LSQSALHGLNKLLVAGALEHRIADYQRLTSARCPAIDSAQSSVPLDCSHRAWIEFVMDDVPAIAMKIEAFAESIGGNEDIRAKRAVEERQHRVRGTRMKDCTICNVAPRWWFSYRHNSVSMEIGTSDRGPVHSK